MFEIIRLEKDMNIFFIVKKDIVSGSFFKELPISVYGFLRVDGSSYINSTVAYRNIADEVTSKDLDELAELAKLKVWNVD